LLTTRSALLQIIELLAVPTSEESLMNEGVEQEKEYFGAATLASSVGHQAACAFNLIMQDNPIFLNAHSHCHVK